ncbi:MAG: hypothetical protein C0501_24875 [Isosphaera sp.]|nr:hypothetical protein [Isosphaera sp.]
MLRWDPANGKELGAVGLKVPGSSYGSGFVTGPVTLSPDGTRALASDGNGVGLYDLPAGTQQFVIPGSPDRGNTVTFAPDGARLVQVQTALDSSKFPARVAVWDAASARRLGGVELPGAPVVAAAVSPDGKTLFTAATRPGPKDGPAEFVTTGWDLGTGAKRGERVDPTGYGPVFVAATGDNATAVVTDPRGATAVVDFVTGKKVRDLDLGGRRPAAAPVVGPDGKTVAVAVEGPFGPTPSSPVLLADVTTGKVTRTLEGATGRVTVVAFAPDGKTLVTGSNDTTALVWDLK